MRDKAAQCLSKHVRVRLDREGSAGLRGLTVKEVYRKCVKTRYSERETMQISGTWGGKQHQMSGDGRNAQRCC